MAVSSYAASDLDSSIETDAVPIAPPPAHCQETEKHPKFEANSPTWSSPAKESAGDLSDPDEGDVKGSATGALVEFSCVDEPSSPSSAVTSSQLNAGDFKVENSAVEIGNSQSVHFGHNVRNQTDINVKTAKSVVIDRRQYNYTYPSYPNTQSTSQRNPPAPSLSIIEKVQDFNRNRYLERLATMTPLPWCTRFSPHLDNIYTTVQLVSSDRFNGRSSHINIPLEQILGEKRNDGDEQSASRCDSTSQPRRPCRVLIEGNPGYGKTTLTLKMALDWAAKKLYMNKFQLVFLIQLRHFKGDLQSYIFDEFIPRHEDEGRDDWWRHVKENQEQILFILDGLDELAREHRDSIDMLIKGKLLDRASLVVTSRLVPSDDSVLSCFSRRIWIRGFSEGETEQVIHNYFQFFNEPQKGSKLKRLLNGPRWCGRQLTSCPLTCLLLCTVFDDEDDPILSKITDVYCHLVDWLIRRTASVEDYEKAKRDGERALRYFGNLCIQALAKGRMTFTWEELDQLPGNSGKLLLKLGLLVQSHTLGNTMRNPKNLCYQLIHKTFLEYLGAYYLSFQVEEHLTSNFELLQSECFTRESLHLTFKFLAGLLGDKAHTLFRFPYLSHFDLPMLTLYELLHEGGATPENVRAVSSILDSDFVLVQSKQVELDAWARLLVEPDCPIRCLKFLWARDHIMPIDANGTLETAALDFKTVERFITAFQTNTSVVCLNVSATMDLSPNEKEANAMAVFTAQALKKCQLRHFSLHVIGDTWSSTVISAVNGALRHTAPSLVTVNINVDLDGNHITPLCQGLRQLSNIKLVVLSKLSCGPDGFVPIASLLKNIQHLTVSLSLIKELPPGNCNSVEEGSPQDLGTFGSYFIESAQQRAGINSNGHQISDEADTELASDDLLPSRRTSTSSASIFDDSQSNSFSLKDGLRYPGIMAPRAIGLSGLTVPGCPADGSHSSGFHVLFTALKDPECRLVRLDLTGCYLGINDFHCLGEALRISPSVQALRFARLQMFEEVFPILINTRLKWLDLSSSLISVNNVSTIQLIKALSSAEQLTALSLAGWKFNITDPLVIREVRMYMKVSRLQELSLANCRIQLIVNGKKTDSSMPFIGQMRQCHSINWGVGDEKLDRFPRFFRSMSLHSLTSLSSSSSSSSPSPSTSSSPLQSAPFFPTRRTRLQGLKRFTMSSSSLSDSVSSGGYHHQNIGECWPHLIKLSLAAAVVSCQMDDGKPEYFTGPELIMYLDGLKNLSELSVSLKSKIIGEVTFDTPKMNDHLTRRFFSLLQRKFGKTLTRLHMSCCSITWHRPSQTAMYLIRHLRKCEKLVRVELNFSRFRVVASDQIPPDLMMQDNVNSSSDEQNHWLLEAIVCGIPHLEELNLTGMELTAFQASALARQIRDKWKGVSLRIHTREVADSFVLDLMQYLKNCLKFHVEYVGGSRDTILVQRRSHLCGLFRYLLTSSTSETGESTTSDACQEHSDPYTSLLPDHRNLLGLTPFDFSIMHAHLWNTKSSTSISS